MSDDQLELLRSVLARTYENGSRSSPALMKTAAAYLKARSSHEGSDRLDEARHPKSPHYPTEERRGLANAVWRALYAGAG